MSPKTIALVVAALCVQVLHGIPLEISTDLGVSGLGLANVPMLGDSLIGDAARRARADLSNDVDDGQSLIASGLHTAATEVAKDGVALTQDIPETGIDLATEAGTGGLGAGSSSSSNDISASGSIAGSNRGDVQGEIDFSAVNGIAGGLNKVGGRLAGSNGVGGTIGARGRVGSSGSLPRISFGK